MYALGSSWGSSFLRVMQIHPGLNVVTITETSFSLRLSELLARIIPPPTLSKKRIPDGNFLFTGAAAFFKAPLEDFLI